MKYNDLFNNEDISIYNRFIEQRKISPVMWLKIIEEYGNRKFTSDTYVSFFELFEGKVFERIIAMKYDYKNNRQRYQEVVIRCEGCKFIMTKNIYLSGMGGYRVVWDNSNPSKYYWNKNNKDMWISDYRYKLFILNYLNFPQEIDETLKYCGFNENIDNGSEYITVYRVFPEIEILGKLKLNNCYKSITFLNRLRKDKQFRKFVVSQKDHKSYINTQLIIRAYNSKMSVDDFNFNLIKEEVYQRVIKRCECAKVLNKEKMLEYLKGKNIDEYIDFLNAVDYLHLDLNDTKNVYPNDLKYWHDLYVEQVKYAQDKETLEKMGIVYNKYKKLERKVDGYTILLAKTPNELIIEGQTLHHCVGRMGYDKKMANEESLIFFVRTEEETPLYTMELEIETRKIKQFYGDRDSEVPDSVNTIINKKWLPRIKRIKVA